MLRSLILKRLDRLERDLGGSLDYLRHMVRISLRAFFKFVKIIPLARYRRALPPGPIHVARLVASRSEDCGSCVQMAVNAARQEGVSAEVLRAVLDRAPEKLPADLREVYLFAEAVTGAAGEEGPLREAIRERQGEEALIELALAIASARFFPVVKRTLGYATSCSRVTIQV